MHARCSNWRPLEAVLSSQGFSYEAEDLGTGDWQVTFRRPS